LGRALSSLSSLPPIEGLIVDAVVVIAVIVVEVFF
jgi:hypothetical protein